MLKGREGKLESALLRGQIVVCCFRRIVRAGIVLSRLRFRRFIGDKQLVMGVIPLRKCNQPAGRGLGANVMGETVGVWLQREEGVCSMPRCLVVGIESAPTFGDAVEIGLEVLVFDLSQGMNGQ